MAIHLCLSPITFIDGNGCGFGFGTNDDDDNDYDDGYWPSKCGSVADKFEWLTHSAAYLALVLVLQHQLWL